MAQRTVKIGLIQNKVSEDLHENLVHSLELAGVAARQGARIICLQESLQNPVFSPA